MSQPTLCDKQVGPIGYGLMGLTWRHDPPPSAASIEVMKTALELGANNWNGGELYGTLERHSCHLLNEYFTKYPEDASKVVLSIKGGLIPGKMVNDGSDANVRRSVEDCLRVLDGKKSIDIFECARQDARVPVEETMKALDTLRREGKIGGIGLSEVREETIRRAAAVAPIAAVELELSLWATDILENGIAAACGELDIPIIAYSPLCRGALTETGVRRNADLPAHDFRKHLPKFQDDVLEYNNKITDEVGKLAQRKGCTKAQVAIAWVRQLSYSTLPTGQKLGLIIPLPGASSVERVRENTKIVELTEEEMTELMDVVKQNPTKGERYHTAALMNT